MPETPPRPDPTARAAVPEDPALGLDPEQVHAAQELAHRERKIREELQAMIAERVPQQQEIRDEAAALARPFAELRREIAESSPRASQAAAQAAEILEHQALPPWTRRPSS